MKNTLIQKMPFLALLLPLCALYGEEALPNGIVIPDKWPLYPETLTRAPLTEPPYLREPPKLIPIDIGRQLFVDDFLIEQTTLKRTNHQPEYHSASPVFTPDQPWEGNRAAVFSDGVWFDPQDQLQSVVLDCRHIPESASIRHLLCNKR